MYKGILSSVLVLALTASTCTATEYSFGDLLNIAEEKLSEKVDQVSQFANNTKFDYSENGSLTVINGNVSLNLTKLVNTTENVGKQVSQFGNKTRIVGENGSITIHYENTSFNLTKANLQAFAAGKQWVKTAINEPFKPEGNESLNNSTVFNNASAIITEALAKEEVRNFTRPIRAANISSLML